jgi:AcrR family transcriptional regulator
MATPGAKRGPRRRDAPRKGDLREQAILDAAETQLEEHGFDAMTVEAIANAAGISRGSLYFYFGSKQDVLTALVARTTALVAEDAALALADTGEETADVVRRTLARTEDNWRKHGRVMRAAVDLSGVIPEVNRLWVDAMKTSIDALTALLVRAGFSEGRGPEDARAVARTLCFMTERNYYVASSGALGQQSLRSATTTCWLVWSRTLEGAAGPTG